MRFVFRILSLGVSSMLSHQLQNILAQKACCALKSFGLLLSSTNVNSASNSPQVPQMICFCGFTCTVFHFPLRRIAITHEHRTHKQTNEHTNTRTHETGDFSIERAYRMYACVHRMFAHRPLAAAAAAVLLFSGKLHILCKNALMHVCWTTPANVLLPVFVVVALTLRLVVVPAHMRWYCTGLV